MNAVHADHEVFTISGRIAGGDEREKGAFVVAESAKVVTEAFAEWGFEITAIASLADVNQNLEILEAIASKDPRVVESEFLDLLPSAGAGRREARHIFSFIGQIDQAGPDSPLQAGFATAPDRSFLIDYLRQMGFNTFSAMSYGDAKELHQQMQRIACEQDDDESQLVNFKNL